MGGCLRWGSARRHSGIVLAGLWTLLVAIEPLIDVVAAPGATCPSAEDVGTKLQALSAASEAGPPRGRDVVTLEQNGAVLRVTLRAAGGTVLGQRTFDRGHSCGDLASAVALTVATWESDVHPEFVPALPRAGGDAGDRGPPTSTPPRVDAAMATAGAPPTVRHARKQAPPPPPHADADAVPRIDLGAALLAQLAPSHVDGALETAVATGLAVGGGWVPRSRGLGVRLTAGTTTERIAVLSDGEARWRRVTAAIGPQLRWPVHSGRATFDLHGAVVAAVLNLRGSGFWTNQSEWSLDLGGTAGARVWLGTGRWRPSIELSLLVWPREHILYTRPNEATATLPRAEALLSLGLAFVMPGAPPS